MAFSELVAPVAAMADDLPGILRVARAAHGKPKESPRDPSASPSILDTLKQYVEKVGSAPVKLSAEVLGERILLKRALRQYLSS